LTYVPYASGRHLYVLKMKQLSVTSISRLYSIRSHTPCHTLQGPAPARLRASARSVVPVGAAAVVVVASVDVVGTRTHHITHRVLLHVSAAALPEVADQFAFDLGQAYLPPVERPQQTRKLFKSTRTAEQ
jgi:hypothetical protein